MRYPSKASGSPATGTSTRFTLAQALPTVLPQRVSAPATA